MLQFKHYVVSSPTSTQHDTTPKPIQNHTKTPHALFIYIKIHTHHQTGTKQAPTATHNRPDRFGGKTKPTRPPHPPQQKKAITKAIGHISTQTLHQPFKLIKAKTHTKNDTNLTLASKCARK